MTHYYPNSMSQIVMCFLKQNNLLIHSGINQFDQDTKSQGTHVRFMVSRHGTIVPQLQEVRESQEKTRKSCIFAIGNVAKFSQHILTSPNFLESGMMTQNGPFYMTPDI